MLFPSFFNAGAPAYEIEQSLRFDGSAYLTRTNGAGSNLRTFTFSFWSKAKAPGSGSGVFFEAWNGAWTDWSTIAFSGDGILAQNRVSGTTYGINSANSNIFYRDPSAWMHFVFSFNNAVPTLYANGVEVSLTNNNSSDWYLFKNGLGLRIGSRNADYTEILQGYLAEVHAVNGSALSPTDFGEFDNNGVWRPIEYTGSHGTNGFYLKFDPTAANGIGHDHSGNGNHFTPTNFTISGTGTDVFSDTPTTNWATLNSIDPIAVTFSEGNLKAAGTNNWETARSTIAMTTGKWYWEVTPTHSSSYVLVGVVNKDANITEYVGQNANGWAFRTQTGEIYNNASGTAYGSATASGVVLGFAFDADTGKMWVRNASGFFNSGDPAAGTNPAMTAGAGEYYVGLSAYETSASNTANFGQRDFAYTPPTGFKALNTKNLSSPPIKDGSKHFNTVLYIGNGSTQSITGVGFQPDLVWIKNRDSGYAHALVDAVRGATKSLHSDETTVERTSDVTSIDSDGFSLQFVNANGTYSENQNTQDYVAWNWLAGNGTSSIATGSVDGTNPTIASTVSVNASAGFSIVTYAGSSTGGDTIAHGLGVPPKMIIAKSRGGGTYPTASWAVYHESLGADKSLTLDTNNKEAGPYTNPATMWYNTTPTSTHFFVGNLNENNGDNDYVAYCFAEVEGYSKFGIFPGNYQADGVCVYLGFTPAFLMFKNAERTNTDWTMIDAARDYYNTAGKTLRANLDSLEDTPTEKLDILSNGFKLRTTDLSYNGPDGAPGIIYAAFASNPFGGDGVSPATAR